MEEKRSQIEKALNELITRCADKGGFVWIVDKRGNDFYLRLTKEVKLRAYEPSKTKEDSNGLD